ncbi:MAG: VanZ family protein [Roseburia sp.]|nr:VanZ family protein [Roseburia sp.]
MVDYIVDLMRIMLAGLPGYLLLRAFWLKWRPGKRGENTGTKECPVQYSREIFMGIFVLFMLALVTFVCQGEYSSIPDMLKLAKERVEHGTGINLVPFRTISNYYRHFGIYGDLFWVNIAGNVLMFVPWGFGLLFLWKKNRKLYRLIFFSIMFPVGIEFVQLFINRQVDIDDIILNFLGGLLGGLIYWLFFRNTKFAQH